MNGQATKTAAFQNGASTHGWGTLTLATFALASLTTRLEATDTGAEATSLRRHYEQAGGEEWRTRLERYLQSPALTDRPLLDIAARLPLTLVEMLSVALAALVEADTVAGQAVAYLQHPTGGSRPTLGLLTTLIEGTGLPHFLTGQALASGLLTFVTADLPLVERPVKVPTHLFAALHGVDLAVSGTRIGVTDPITVASGVSEALRRHAMALQGQQLLIIRARTLAEGKAAAAEVAIERGCRPLFIQGEPPVALGVWAHSRRLLPIFMVEVAPGERMNLPVLPAYDAPLVVVTGLEGHIEREGYTSIQYTMPLPIPDERRALWQNAIGTPDLVDVLARDHRLGAEQIQRVGSVARHFGALAGRTVPDGRDVRAAVRAGDTLDLHALAQHQPDTIPDEALVITEELRRHLELLVQRCRTRERLSTGLGVAASARYTPGVRALFTGISGTGKTLAAGWLATRLGIPLFRVDTAGITSKYIGETEKNLAQLLAHAEAGEVILLFDEADALFAKRTEIKESNDRFANAQTNYLLQRIETFDGIAILTSNSRTRFDSAFTRRLDLIIEFPPPGAEERRSLWGAHLGERNGLTLRELNHLAAVVDVAGGHIRNMVLLAAVVADGRNITYSDIVQGVAAEYAKLGRNSPI